MSSMQDEFFDVKDKLEALLDDDLNIREDSPPPEPPKAEAPPAPPPVAEAEDTPTPEEVQPEPEADAEEAPTPEPEPEAEEPEGIELETMTELAEHLGVEEADLLEGLRIGDHSLGEIVAREGDLTASAAPEAVAQKQREYDQLIERQTQEHGEGLKNLAQTTQVLIQQMQDEGRSPEQWRELEESDQSLYAYERLKVQERGNHINQAIGYLRQEEEKQMAAENENSLKWRTDEAKTLVQKMGWKDQDTVRSELSEVERYLTTEGLSPEEITDIADHRYVQIAWKAAQYDKIKAATTGTRKKLRLSKRRTLRANARRDVTVEHSERSRKIIDRAKGTDDENAIVRGLMELLDDE